MKYGAGLLNGCHGSDRIKSPWIIATQAAPSENINRDESGGIRTPGPGPIHAASALLGMFSPRAAEALGPGINVPVRVVFGFLAPVAICNAAVSEAGPSFSSLLQHSAAHGIAAGFGTRPASSSIGTVTPLALDTGSCVT